MKRIAPRSDFKELIIREAIGSDYEALCHLFDQADEFHRKRMPQFFRKPEGECRDSDYVENLMADANAGLFVAQLKERLVGLICCFMRETPDIPILVPRKYIYIENLVVDKNHRRKGIGKALLEQAHSWAIENEINEIELNVWQFNDDAIRLYEKMGYKTTMLRMNKMLE